VAGVGVGLTIGGFDASKALLIQATKRLPSVVTTIPAKASHRARLLLFSGATPKPSASKLRLDKELLQDLEQTQEDARTGFG
jgi:hypothetical protein